MYGEFHGGAQSGFIRLLFGASALQAASIRTLGFKGFRA